MRRTFTLVLAAILLSCTCLLAQTDRGSINGSVADSTGASVPGAIIMVTNPATGATVTTRATDSGTYTVADLPVGVYTVRVEKEGFKLSVRSGIILNAASAVRVDFSLQVGSTRQTIEVTGGVTPLNTETAKESATISNVMVQDLPIVVGSALRSPLDLASLTPEAKNYNTAVANGAAAPGTNTSDSFSIGGGQPRAFGITLDGVTMMAGNSTPNSWVTYNTPPLDAITEFTVETNGYKAEFGHAQGGVMTFSSKTGTNALHGSAFEFLRNTDLDANYFFSNENGIPRSIYKQNDFGINAGGPVIIPHIINGKKQDVFLCRV